MTRLQTVFCIRPSAPLRGRLRSDSLRSPLLHLPRRGAEQSEEDQFTERNLHSPFTTVHCTFSWKLRKLRPDDLVLESLVVSFLVIVFNELKNCLAQSL